MYGERKSTYRSLVVKSGGQRLGKLRRKWEDNINRDLQKVG
jgi:hypothetical protein